MKKIETTISCRVYFLVFRVREVSQLVFLKLMQISRLLGVIPIHMKWQWPSK